jgi:hypothetical protein
MVTDGWKNPIAFIFRVMQSKGTENDVTEDWDTQ